jgi:hypothetical protein
VSETLAKTSEKTIEKLLQTICNIQIKHLQHMYETLCNIQINTLATYVRKTDETFGTDACNICV